VGDAARQLAHSLHLLRLAQLLLCGGQFDLPLAFGRDVTGHGMDQVLSRHCRPREVAIGAILVLVAVFEAQRRQALGQ